MGRPSTIKIISFSLYNLCGLSPRSWVMRLTSWAVDVRKNRSKFSHRQLQYFQKFLSRVFVAVRNSRKRKNLKNARSCHIRSYTSWYSLDKLRRLATGLRESKSRQKEPEKRLEARQVFESWQTGFNTSHLVAHSSRRPNVTWLLWSSDMWWSSLGGS